MKENEFYNFLIESGIRESAAATRLRRGREAESFLNHDFEEIIKDDDLMYDSLRELRNDALDNPSHSPLQNSLRRYYVFRNGKEFPRLNNYKIYN